MRFPQPLPFDIPDPIWLATGAQGWRPAARYYAASAYRDALSGNPHDDLAVERVPLDLIVPPVRTGGAPWFVDERMLHALLGMVGGGGGGRSPPSSASDRVSDDPAALVQIVDGMHRVYASAALGFTHLPVAIRPYWEP